jgi:hypothetical protein
MNWDSHSVVVASNAGKTILESVYGMDVKDSSDRFVQIAVEALEALSAAGPAGSYLVDTFPVLRYIPDWFPGAAFKKQAKEWRKSVTAMPKETLEYMKTSMVSRYEAAHQDT